MRRVGRAAVRGVADRRRGRDQPLVVEVGAAERGLEEVVQDRVLRVPRLVQVLVHGQLGGVVGAHHEPCGVALQHVPVLLPTVELELLLVEAVHDVARTAAGTSAGYRQTGCRVDALLAEPVREAERRQDRWARDVVGLEVVVDRERRVREVARERPAGRVVAGRAQRARGVRRRLRLQVRVVLVQALVRRERARPGLPDLRRVRGIGVGEAANALPAAVQVVEAVVLLVDDDDVVDLAELVVVALPWLGGRAARDDERATAAALSCGERREDAGASKTSSVVVSPLKSLSGPDLRKLP